MTPMEREYPAICKWVNHSTVPTEDLRQELMRALAWASGVEWPVKLGPLKVNGKPIPKEITEGSAADFARYCGATDPAVLAILDAEAIEGGAPVAGQDY